MADSATCAGSIRVSKVLGATGEGMRSRRSLKPNLPAVAAMPRSPISAPSRAKTVLHEARKASLSGASAHPFAAFPSRVAVPGRG